MTYNLLLDSRKYQHWNSEASMVLRGITDAVEDARHETDEWLRRSATLGE